MLLAGMAVGWILLKAPSQEGFKAVFLDVGQGDGICLRTEETVILVDCGSSDEKRLGEQVVEPFLKSQGISQIDYAIVSHGDKDHISGLSYLLESSCGIRRTASEVSGCAGGIVWRRAAWQRYRAHAGGTGKGNGREPTLDEGGRLYPGRGVGITVSVCRAGGKKSG